MDKISRLFMISLATLGIGIGIAGSVLLIRWQATRQAQGDIPALLNQSSQHLVQGIQSRRQTLVLLRDVLDQTPFMQEPEREALAESTSQNVPHLKGLGWIKKRGIISWWVAPPGLDDAQLANLQRQISSRMWLRNIFRSPAVLEVHLPEAEIAMIMIEPLRSPANRPEKLIGFFDLAGMMRDFERTAQPAKINLRSAAQGPQPRVPGAFERVVAVDDIHLVLTALPTQAPARTPWLGTLLTIALLCAAASVAGMLFSTRRLAEMATTDELTGLYNRRFFLERWEAESDRARRYSRPLSCLTIDIDNFKRINDSLGHAAGDQVLRKAALDMKSSLRNSDVLARMGGDEFIVALPETGLEQARMVAQKVRAIEIELPDGSKRTDLGPVRLSVGIAALEQEEDSEEVLRKADADLYQSKKSAQAFLGKPPLRVSSVG